MTRANLQNRIILAIIGLAALAATYHGWRLFWFLTDDAFIAFRYVSNAIAGHGYTWNPPPFRPIEGYTSFLWVATLEMIWRWFDIQPPAAANWISLLCSYGSLWIIMAMVSHYTLTGSWGLARGWAIGLVALGIVSNRTFLTWSSSGLETALFNFLIHLWIYTVLYIRPENRGWMWSVSSIAALTYLCRPDGMLVGLATLGIAAVSVLYNHRNRPLIRHLLLGLLPLTAIPLHFAWRKTRYGEWLPNTYYAKHVAAWPESGARYLGSFILEYALWIWILVLLVWLWRQLGPMFAHPKRLGLPSQRSLLIAAVCLTVLGHLTYYTLIIGGDHFEYRVYSHLVPLIFASFPWLLDRLSRKRPLNIALLLTFIIASWAVPWTHWYASKDLNQRETTHAMIVPVAKLWPISISWYAQPFDQMQAWLIEHRVCMRHQEHKIFVFNQQHYIPERETILRQFSANSAAAGAYPVIAYGSVGVLGWRMAPINIIDTTGLNDYVVARNPVAPHQSRMMAHDRIPPAGYAECFSPNVEPRVSLDYYESKQQMTSMRRYIRISPRAEPLTAEKIRECESRTWY